MEQQARASARHVRISPQKARPVIDLVRGKSVDEALAILQHTPRRAAGLIAKVINSAAANAVNNFDMDEDELFIAECYINEGATLRRFRPRARGMAAPIQKRTSHIEVVLEEREEV